MPVHYVGEDSHWGAPHRSRNRQRYPPVHLEKVLFGSISGYIGYYDLETKKVHYYEPINEEIIRGVLVLLFRYTAKARRSTLR